MLRFFRNIYFFLLWAFQIVRLLRYRNRSKSAIIAYCGITSTEHNNSATNIDGRHLRKKMFERQLRYLKKHYKIMPLSDLIKCLRNEEQQPTRTVALTFDYGYMNAYTNAFKRLNSDSIPFAVSPVTRFIDSRDLLWLDRLEFAISRSRNERFCTKIGETLLDEPLTTPRQKARAYRKINEICANFDLKKREMLIREVERQTERALGAELTIPDDYCGLGREQIRELSKSEVEIGSQSAHLLDLAKISGRDLRTEILTSKQQIEKIIGGQCLFFTYPFRETNAFNQGIAQLIAKCGYHFALTKTPGFIAEDFDPYSIPRITISDKDSFFTFVARLAGIGIKRK